ncbi:MAG: S41 family peptidase [Firmicutes bacterium]|nr:S41 family peptidase [Bacillota bacterium]
MNRRHIRLVAIVLAAALIVTSFSFVMVLPVFGGENNYAYGAEIDSEGILMADAGADSEKIEGLAESLNLQREMNILFQYLQFIHENYKDEVSYEVLLNGAYEGIIEALGDKYSVFYENEEESSEFTESVTGTFGGVGVQFSVENDVCLISNVISGSPAEKAGIKGGDIITAVDGASILGLDANSVAALIRGEKGTAVKLTVLRDNQQLEFDVVRDTVKETCVAYEMLDEEIGYISMTGFDSDAALEFKMAHIALTNQGAEKIILDLRDNGGGLVDQAIEIADIILESGDISHFVFRDEIYQTHTATATETMLQELVVLVNENTASASEILAGALKDNKAKEIPIVGVTTFGKGIAQQVVSIGEDKGMKLSTLYFLTPDKNVIHETGIEPDYFVSNYDLAVDKSAAQAVYKGFAPMSEKVKPKAGDIGLNVYGAQQRLAFLGYGVIATGTMDADTVAAITKFQAESGLYPYGVLDYTTAAKLDEAAAYYAYGVSAEDMQLQKAIELLK